jgi:hypothetical protein
MRLRSATSPSVPSMRPRELRQQGAIDSGMMPGSGGGMAAERAGAVGLVRRTTGAVGSTVSAGIGAGAVPRARSRRVVRSPCKRAVVRWTAWTPQDSSPPSAAQGSAVTSTGKSVRPDQGTRLLLSAQAGPSGEARRREADAAKPSASCPVWGMRALTVSSAVSRQSSGFPGHLRARAFWNPSCPIAVGLQGECFRRHHGVASASPMP